MADILEVIRRGRLHELRDLLDEGESLGNTAPTLLETALTQNDESLAMLLIERGAIDPLTAVDANEQALHHCARSGAEQVAGLLLDRGAQIEAQNLTGQTPLMVAAANRYGGRMVALLLDRGASAGYVSYAHVGPLHLAARSGSARSVRLLLEAGASPNAISYEAGLQGGPLHYAMAREDKEAGPIVHALLKAGADPKVANRERLAPVHLAADARKSAALRPLLEKIAPLGIVDQLDKEQSTALLRACRAGHTENIRALLEGGANIEACGPQAPRARPLHLAIPLLSTEPLQLLIKAGAELDAPLKDGRTALHLAALEDRAEAMELLLEAGAAVDATDRSGVTPLMIAAIKSSTHPVERLLAHGADPDVAVSGPKKVAGRALEPGDSARSIASAAIRTLFEASP